MISEENTHIRVIAAYTDILASPRKHPPVEDDGCISLLVAFCLEGSDLSSQGRIVHNLK